MLFSLSFHSYNDKIIHLGYVFFRDPFHESLECALREELRAQSIDPPLLAVSLLSLCWLTAPIANQREVANRIKWRP